MVCSGIFVLFLYALEETLRNSGVSHTFVRSGGLTNKPAGETYLGAAAAAAAADVNATKEAGAGSISRADVAAVCVEALTNPAAANKTLSIYGAKQTLGEEQGLSSEITRLFGAI
jgi:uncharacterized protein YbjT (DUF2867 family)